MLQKGHLELGVGMIAIEKKESSSVPKYATLLASQAMAVTGPQSPIDSQLQLATRKCTYKVITH